MILVSSVFLFSVYGLLPDYFNSGLEFQTMKTTKTENSPPVTQQPQRIYPDPDSLHGRLGAFGVLVEDAQMPELLEKLKHAKCLHKIAVGAACVSVFAGTGALWATVATSSNVVIYNLMGFGLGFSSVTTFGMAFLAGLQGRKIDAVEAQIKEAKPHYVVQAQPVSVPLLRVEDLY